MSSRRILPALLLALAALLLAIGAACSNDSSDAPPAESAAETETETAASREQDFPDVVGVEVSGADGTYDFAVTVSSPYDTPERYADGWRVLAPDGTVLGERPLAHDHANEQPFTRSLIGVEIPAGINEVTVEARDLANGYGGETVTVDLPEGDS